VYEFTDTLISQHATRTTADVGHRPMTRYAYGLDCALTIITYPGTHAIATPAADLDSGRRWRVGPSLRKRRTHARHSRGKLVPNELLWKPQHAVTALGQPTVAPCVGARPVDVVAAVDLHDET
jgi:hypothetical protein